MLRDLVPFFALPLCIFLPFALPPFYGRNLLFIVLISFANYTCIVSPWPPDNGPTRPMRYGLTGSWIFLLPAIQRLLLHDPEKEFWRLDEEKMHRRGRPAEWTLQKASWAFTLVITPRAVGWNFGDHRLNTASDIIRKDKEGTAMYVLTRLFRITLAYLALDGVVLLARHIKASQTWAWDLATLGRIGTMEILMAVSVYSTMLLQFEIAAAISVGFGFSKKEDWPPLFGSISSCYTISNVWGKFWHGYIRQSALGLSRAAVDGLHIPRRSLLAYTVHLVTAFSTSALFHILSLAVVSSGHVLVKDLVLHMGIFFMAQAIGTIAESLVIKFYNDCHQAHGSRISESGKVSKQNRDIVSNFRYLGYLWVVIWFFTTGWWFVQDYVAIGVLEWDLPFSVWNLFLSP